MLSWLVLFLKFALPILIVFFPFIAGWANFVLDSVDGDILIPLGLTDNLYQLIDKSADWCTYLGMTVASWKFKWGIRKWIYIFFIFRTVGQIAFFLLKDERVFFLFPNFLEPLFLIYTSIAYFKRSKAAEFYLKHRPAIWIFVILYKLQDEWITHIANIDRTELIKKLLS